MKNEASMMRGVDWLGEPVAGTYASRKLNGAAMLWSGSDGFTRSGKLIALPAHIRDTLPALPLDCEIVSGAGNNSDFNAASVAVRLNRWTPDIHAVCFDAPQAAGDWAQRIEAARNAGADSVSWTVCQSEKDLLWLFTQITNAGGEGVMLRNHGKGYRAGRSQDLLKVKPGCHHLYELMEFEPYAVSAHTL